MQAAQLHGELFNNTFRKALLPTSLLVDIGETTLATVMAVKVVGHEGSCSALGVRALLAQALYLSGIIHLVVLQYR